MREVCFLVGVDGQVLWSDAGSASALPDSPLRWQAIWELRDRLGEIAHSHPFGPLSFSTEDETTMAALTAALGRSLRFSVVAPEGMITRMGDRDVFVADEPRWAAELRRQSQMREVQLWF